MASAVVLAIGDRRAARRERPVSRKAALSVGSVPFRDLRGQKDWVMLMLSDDNRPLPPQQANDYDPATSRVDTDEQSPCAREPQISHHLVSCPLSGSPTGHDT
jgi:hypothetical protein